MYTKHLEWIRSRHWKIIDGKGENYYAIDAKFKTPVTYEECQAKFKYFLYKTNYEGAYWEAFAVTQGRILIIKLIDKKTKKVMKILELKSYPKK